MAKKLAFETWWSDLLQAEQVADEVDVNAFWSYEIEETFRHTRPWLSARLRPLLLAGVLERAMVRRRDRWQRVSTHQGYRILKPDEFRAAVEGW